MPARSIIREYSGLASDGCAEGSVSHKSNFAQNNASTGTSPVPRVNLLAPNSGLIFVEVNESSLLQCFLDRRRVRRRRAGAAGKVELRTAMSIAQPGSRRRRRLPNTNGSIATSRRPVCEGNGGRVSDRLLQVGRYGIFGVADGAPKYASARYRRAVVLRWHFPRSGNAQHARRRGQSASPRLMPNARLTASGAI